MNTKEENNVWSLILSWFTLLAPFVFIIVAVYVYYIVMYNCFNCGHDPEPKPLWGSAANFGNMFGALGCFFSGLAFAAMWATLKKQGEQLKSQEESLDFMKKSIDKQAESIKCQKDELDYAKNKNDKDDIFKMISIMIEARDSLQYEKQAIGQAVSKKLYEKLKDSLNSFASYLKNSDPYLKERFKKEAVDAYGSIIDTYLPISAIFLHIVDSATLSNNMNEDEKTKVVKLALHSLSIADNRLMRVVLSHEDYSHTFHKLEYTKVQFGNDTIIVILSNLLNNGMSDEGKKAICTKYLDTMHKSEQP